MLRHSLRGLLLALTPVFTAPLAAQSEEPTVPTAEEVAAAQAATRAPTQAETRAAKTVAVSGAFGVCCFPVPVKKGAQLTYLYDSKWQLEADYSSGDISLGMFGIDLVSLSERLVTLKARKFWEGTFNLSFGLGERRYAFELNGFLVDQIPVEALPSSKLIEIERYVATFGLGNRWHFPSGLTVGADWFEIALPFGATRTDSPIIDALPNAEDRAKADKAVSYLQRFPTISVVKAHIGYAF